MPEVVFLHTWMVVQNSGQLKAICLHERHTNKIEHMTAKVKILCKTFGGRRWMLRDIFRPQQKPANARRNWPRAWSRVAFSSLATSAAMTFSRTRLRSRPDKRDRRGKLLNHVCASRRSIL